MRVLHLIEAGSRQSTSATLALAAEAHGRLGDVEQQVMLVGPGQFARQTRELGLPADQQIAAVAGRAWLGWPRTHRAIRQAVAQAGRKGPVAAIHCWSIGTLSLAALLLPQVPRVLTVTLPTSRRAVHWLRLLIREAPGRTELLPISGTLAQSLLQGGVPENAVHVLRPGIDQGRVKHSQRQPLRQQWNATSDQVRIIALLSDPATTASAHAAALAVEIANEIFETRYRQQPNQPQPDLRLLVHPQQADRLRALRMVRQIGHPERLITEPRLAQPWQVLPGCDAALCIGPDGGGLSLLWAMAANVPIIGEATYATSEIVEDRHSALLAVADQPKTLAHRLTQLMPDRMLAWKLRDTARHEAFSFFSRQRYCQSLQAVYQQLAENQPITIPEMEATGGLRFTGRAG